MIKRRRFSLYALFVASHCLFAALGWLVAGYVSPSSSQSQQRIGVPAPIWDKAQQLMAVLDQDRCEPKKGLELVDANGLCHAFYEEIDNVRFCYCVLMKQAARSPDRMGIAQVQSSTPGLELLSGIKIGQTTLRQISRQTGINIRREPGFCTYVRLPNGWYAGSKQVGKAIAADNTLLAEHDDTVDIVFRRYSRWPGADIHIAGEDSETGTN